MTDRKKPGLAFWATVVVAIVVIPVAAYFGAYAYLVRPTRIAAVAVSNSGRDVVLPLYPDVGHKPFWRAFFLPANWLDKHVRPDVWRED